MNRLMSLFCWALMAGITAGVGVVFAAFATMAGVDVGEAFRQLGVALVAVGAYYVISNAWERHRESVASEASMPTNNSSVSQ